MAASADIDYEIWRLLDKRVSADNVVEYLVRWKGFNSDWDTWEPAYNLQNCIKKISAFEKKLKKSLTQKYAQKLVNKSKMGKTNSVKILAVKGKIKDGVKQKMGHKKKISGMGAGSPAIAVPKNVKNTPGSVDISLSKGEPISTPKLKNMSSPSKKSPKSVNKSSVTQSGTSIHTGKKKGQITISNKENLKTPSGKQNSGSSESKAKLLSPKSVVTAAQQSVGKGIKHTPKLKASPSPPKGNKIEVKQKRKADPGTPGVKKNDTAPLHTTGKKSSKLSENESLEKSESEEPPAKKAKLSKSITKSKEIVNKSKSLSGKDSNSTGSLVVEKQSVKQKPQENKSGAKDKNKPGGKDKKSLTNASNGKKNSFKISVAGIVGKNIKSPLKSSKSNKLKLSSLFKNNKSISVGDSTTDSESSEELDDDDDDDDDILYFLPDSESDSNSSPENEKNNTKSKSVSNAEETADNVGVSKKPKSVLEGMKKPGNSKAKKIRLLDSLKQDDIVKKSVLPVRPVSPTPLYTAVKHTEGAGPHMGEVSQSRSRWILMEDNNLVPAGADVQASLPISPASMSYKVLLENLPHQLHPKKNKRGGANGEDGDEDVERRISVRASECAFKYKEILIKKCQKYTQIWLNTHTHMKNALNPQVMQELCSALNAAKYDDSNLVMFSGLGNVFCSGIDLNFLTLGDKRVAARKMVDALRDLVRKFITFPKLIVAVVTGPAIGLGCSLLPLCDIVYASDKSTFYMPYAQLCQTPEGCASYTMPDCVGTAMANELLIGGRKITAIEACQLGLVSQVYWPTSMMQEVIPRVQHMALLSGKVLETTKLLIRSHQRTKLDLTNESECNLLLECWPSTECQRAIGEYVSNEKNYML